MQQHFSVGLSLSHNIIVQKRSVYSFLMMFGDVGGLHDFISLILSAVFGLFSEKFSLVSLSEQLFH